jgi:REP element-mobilizing transposase RayT
LPDDSRRDFRRFAKQLESEMDAGHGECVLRRSTLSSIVAASLHHFNGTRYTLGDFVVMPNHVHLLVGGMPRDSMLAQVKSWKKWSALRINEVLGRKGRFWQDEHFDHLVRNESAFQKFRFYIAENPVKTRLRGGEYVHWRRPD